MGTFLNRSGRSNPHFWDFLDGRRYRAPYKLIPKDNRLTTIANVGTDAEDRDARITNITTPITTKM